MGAVQIFKKLLKDLAAHNAVGSLYVTLFNLKSEDDLADNLSWIHSLYKGTDSYWKDQSLENWFAIWHKSIRQCDFFDGYFKRNDEKLLTDTDRERLRELHPKFYDKTKSEDERETAKVNNKAEYDEYMRLWNLQHREKALINISGTFDSLLYNTVNVDKGELYNVFRRLFLEMELAHVNE